MATINRSEILLHFFCFRAVLCLKFVQESGLGRNMGPKKPKKKKLTKEEKLALKRAEEERIRQEEEAARKLAEREERKRREEERLRQEELERIKREEDQIRETRQNALIPIFSAIERKYRENMLERWKELQWYQYVHVWKTINPLSLPMVNAFISEWEGEESIVTDDDESRNLKEFFSQCHFCFQIIEAVEVALVNCPNLDIKTEALWNEILENSKRTLNKKFNLLTFLLLRNGTLYLSPDSYNMECGITDKEILNIKESDCPKVMICLWANFVQNIRYKGMELPELGFKFELPQDLVMESCAVRFLHTSYDTISSLPFLEKEYITSETTLSTKRTLQHPEAEAASQVTIIEETSHKQEVQGTETETVLSDAKGFSLTSIIVDSSTSTEILPPSSSTSIGGEETASSVLSLPSAEENVASANAGQPETVPVELPPLKKPEFVPVCGEEYFLVGGIFCFDLLKIPTQPVEAGSWILINCEGKVPQKIPYKVTIIPICQPPPNMPLAEAAEFSDAEIKRFEQEMSCAISLSLRLPKGVLFLEKPILALWNEKRHCFSQSGFFDVNLEEDGQLSFKINQFGTIGLLQRKYANHPFKSWEICPKLESKAVSLTLVGAVLNMKIEVNDKGCFLQQISMAEKEVFKEMYKIYMTPAELVKKLFSIGINIEFDETGSKYIGLETKHPAIEEWTYLCMSVLCCTYTFSWSKWNCEASSEKMILNLNCRAPEGTNKEEGESLILVTPERALYLKCIEVNEVTTTEPVENQQFSSDLYHLVTNKASEATMKQLEETDVDLSMNVRLLLESCRLLSCS